MAPHTFQAAANSRIADSFMLVVALILLSAPFIISIFANIGRRPWPSYRTEPVKAKPRSLFAPKQIAA